MRSVASRAASGFRPAKVAVVTKTTRCEFEQQRYRFAGLSEVDLKQLVRMHAVSDHGLLTCTFAVSMCMHLHLGHLAHAFIQSDLQ